MNEIPQLLHFVEWLFIASIKTIPLIVVILMLRRYFRHLFSANAQHLMWFSVLISLVVPVGWNIDIASIDTPVLVTQAQISHEENIDTPTINTLAVSESSSVEGVSKEKSVQLLQSINWSNVIAILWLCGALSLLLITLSKARHYYRIKQRSLSVSPELNALFEVCRQALNLSSSIRLYQSSDISTPIAMGVWRPVVIVPNELERMLTVEQLRHILLHELGHIKRRDVLFNWGVSLINIMHWFNPMVWFACRRMRADMEVACDALVLSHLSSDQHKRYGETLIELSDFLPFSERALSAVGILENHHELKERLKMIKQVTTMNVTRGIVFSIVLMGAAITAFAQPSQKAMVSPYSAIAQKMTLQTFASMAEKVLGGKVLASANDADTMVRVRVNMNELTYATLLTQLKQNGFTAYKSKGVIKFIPIRSARDSAIPVVVNNKTYFDDEVVTENIKLHKACGNSLLPVLRPMVPREGHLTVSESTNMLIVVDSYSNIQRLKAIIQKVEDAMEKPAKCVD